jgi:hypothetical protein
MECGYLDRWNVESRLDGMWRGGLMECGRLRCGQDEEMECGEVD